MTIRTAPILTKTRTPLGVAYSVTYRQHAIGLVREVPGGWEWSRPEGSHGTAPSQVAALDALIALAP